MAEENKVPQHKKIYETLRKHILTGVYEEGSLLPSENELCAVHNITRPTVRQALEALVKDGFISKKQGKGTDRNDGHIPCGYIIFLKLTWECKILCGNTNLVNLLERRLPFDKGEKVLSAEALKVVNADILLKRNSITCFAARYVRWE